ncbi:MAG: 50S ribosomal protein L11 methyltransferase [Bryobacterales bacterium]|nr:50S ribosomal protein L11 methyltransferase [Bryobacterales bacterium]
MVSVLLDCLDDVRDFLIAELSELATTGIVEGIGVIEAYFDTEDEARSVAARYPRHRPRLVVHAERDYVTEFQSAWQPLAIGERLWLAAPWDPSRTPEGRIRIEYQAGMSCGSGAHVCTQLCLEALERELRPGDAMLDVGVGSGILLLAAKELGAGRLAGCDIDHHSVVHGAHAVSASAAVFTGSTRSVRPRSFDIVVANISAPATDLLIGDLCRIARRTVIVSGFREQERHRAWDGKAGSVHAATRDGWVCLTLRV